MLTSRGLKLARILGHVARTHGKTCVQQQRSSHACQYRLPAPPSPKADLFVAELFGGFAWWWILWHLWHEPDHLTGEFEYPDPSKWTDAELGIPPDDLD